MQIRRSLATTAAALIAVPLLASCGFNYNTDIDSDNVAGTTNRDGVVDVSAATIVSSGPDRGTFIANLSNNDQGAGAVFDSLQGGDGNTIVAGDFAPVSIAPGGFVNLADGYELTITGSFGAGDVIPLSIGFDDGSTVSIDVPVVRACEEYAGLDASSTTESTTESPASADESEVYSCERTETEPEAETEPAA